MRTLLRRARRRRPPIERGQSLVEFALALPILLLLVLGIIDLGRGFYYYNLVANLAREGARYAIVAPTNTAEITNRVSQGAVGLDSPDLLVTQVITNGTATGYARGNPITVTVRYTMTAITPLIGGFIPDGLSLRAGSTMLIEGNYP